MSLPNGSTLTVVIPSHNGGESTIACLERVVPQLAEGDRIVVVDNGSWDGTPAAVDHVFGGRVRMIVHRQAMGFARACNAGAAGAITDWVLFLNQDLLLASDGLQRLRDAARMQPDAIIGAVLLEPEGTEVQHAGGVILPNGITVHRHRGLAAGRLPRRGFVACDYVTAAVFLVPTGVFATLGGFDVRFGPAYYEETDFCIRARVNRIRPMVALAVSARHIEAGVMGKDTPRYHFLYHRNRLRFVMKHYRRDALRAFLHAERGWLRTSVPESARRSVGRAYVAALFELPRWLLERRRRPPSFVPQEVAS